MVATDHVADTIENLTNRGAVNRVVPLTGYISRAAPERKIEHREARSVVRKMGIGGQNCERSMIPVHSDVSRFSRGTISCVTDFRLALYPYLLPGTAEGRTSGTPLNRS